MNGAFEGIADASTAVRNWLILHEVDLPEHLHDPLMALTQTGASPVDTAIVFAEAVYANQDEFSDEAKDLAARSSVVGETFGFHGMAQDQRGSRMSKVLNGQTVAKDKIPEEKADLKPPPEPEVPDPHDVSGEENADPEPSAVT